MQALLVIKHLDVFKYEVPLKKLRTNLWVIRQPFQVD